MFPSDLPDLSSSQPHSSPPQPSPRGFPARSNRPPSAFLHPPGWEALGPALGTETEVLTFCGAPPVEVWVVLIDGSPSDPGPRQHLKSQAQLPSLRPDPPTHTVKGPRRAQSLQMEDLCLGLQAQKRPPAPKLALTQ